MRKKRFTLAVYIGRFQSLHDGHLGVIANLKGRADAALILAGSSYRPRSWKNPLTYAERKAFIAAETSEMGIQVDVLPLIDTLYDDRAWATNVRTAVKLYMRSKGLDPESTDIVLTGFEKDSSSRYLRWFPEWDLWPSEPAARGGVILNATDLREALFFPAEGDTIDKIAERFGATAVAGLVDWMDHNKGACEVIRAEGRFNRDYRRKTAEAEKLFGHPIPINTADSVVVQSGHILLFKRGNLPGKGTYALPGGHIRPDETALQASMRELREKTKLDVPPKLLANRFRRSKVFDHPERSERGWVRTEAFLYEFEDSDALEKVRGENGEKAEWFPISEIVPHEMFEDHFDIIQHFVPEVSASYASILMAHVGGL